MQQRATVAYAGATAPATLALHPRVPWRVLPRAGAATATRPTATLPSWLVMLLVASLTASGLFAYIRLKGRSPAVVVRPTYGTGDDAAAAVPTGAPAGMVLQQPPAAVAGSTGTGATAGGSATGSGTGGATTGAGKAPSVAAPGWVPPLEKPQPVGSLHVATLLPARFAYCDAAACTGQTKVISISLYGGNPRYAVGAVRNSEIVRDAFPDWQLWVYIPAPSINPDWVVPDDIKAVLVANGAVLKEVDADTVRAVGFGMNQRFLIADDPTVDRYVVRDGDSRLLLRERWAMDEWEKSGKAFHVLRDHPSHSNFYISGGLWGAVHGALVDARGMLASRQSSKSEYLDDMNWLNEVVWPIMKEKGVRQHDAFSCQRVEAPATGFPYPRAGGEHVGGVYDAEDNIRAGDVALLLPAQAPPECQSPPSVAGSRSILSVREVQQCSASADAATPRMVSAGSYSGCTGPESPRFRGITLIGEQAYVVSEDAGKLAKAGKAAVVWLQWQKAFVDSVERPCSGTSMHVPAVFDYTRMLAITAASPACPPATTADVRQYHERITGGRTHYHTLGREGVHYVHHLLHVDTMYATNTHIAGAFALPAVARFLFAGERGARVLVPPFGAGQAAVAAFAAAGLAGVGAHGVLRKADGTPNPDAGRPPADVFAAPWVMSHEVAPALYYAHRLYVAATSLDGALLDAVGTCASLTCAISPTLAPEAEHCILVAAAMSAVAAGVDRPLQAALHAGLPRNKACSAALIPPGPGYEMDGPVVASVVEMATAAGYLVDAVDSCNEDPTSQLAAIAAADLVILPPATAHSYLWLLRRSATVLVIDDLLDASSSRRVANDAYQHALLTGVCDALGANVIRVPRSPLRITPAQRTEYIKERVGAVLPSSSTAATCTAAAAAAA